MAMLLNTFPNTTFVAGHMGGYLHWDSVIEHLTGRDIFFETSSAAPFMTKEQIKNIFNKHPLDRILFGSDYPLFDPAIDVSYQQKAYGLTDSQMEQVLTQGFKLFS